jgi:hypothetical protein
MHGVSKLFKAGWSNMRLTEKGQTSGRVFGKSIPVGYLNGFLSTLEEEQPVPMNPSEL